jgi:hypothetical protein
VWPGWRKKICIQKFGGEFSRKAIIWKTKKEIGGNVRMETDCEDGRWMGLVQDLV